MSIHERFKKAREKQAEIREPLTRKKEEKKQEEQKKQQITTRKRTTSTQRKAPTTPSERIEKLEDRGIPVPPAVKKAVEIRENRKPEQVVSPAHVPAPFAPTDAGVAAYKTHKAEVMGPQQFIAHASAIDEKYGQQIGSEVKDWHPKTRIYPVYQPDGSVKYDIQIPYTGAQHFHSYSAMLDKHPELIGMRAVTSPFLNVDLAVATPEKRRDIMVEWLHGVRGSPEGGLDWGRGIRTVVTSPFVQIASMKAVGVGLGVASVYAGGYLTGKGVALSPTIAKVASGVMKAGYVGAASYDVHRTYQRYGIGAAAGRGVVSAAMYESLVSGSRIGAQYGMKHVGRTGLTLYERGAARGVARVDKIPVAKARDIVRDIGIRRDVEMASTYYAEPTADKTRITGWGVTRDGIRIKTTADVMIGDDKAYYYGRSIIDKAGRRGMQTVFGEGVRVPVKSDVVSLAKTTGFGLGPEQIAYSKGVSAVGVGKLARPTEALTKYGYFKARVSTLLGVKPRVSTEMVRGIRLDTGTVHPTVTVGGYKAMAPGVKIYGRYTEMGRVFVKTSEVPGAFVESMPATSRYMMALQKMNQQMSTFVASTYAAQPVMMIRPAVTVGTTVGMVGLTAKKMRYGIRQVDPGAVEAYRFKPTVGYLGRHRVVGDVVGVTDRRLVSPLPTSDTKRLYDVGQRSLVITRPMMDEDVVYDIAMKKALKTMPVKKLAYKPTMVYQPVTSLVHHPYTPFIFPFYTPRRKGADRMGLGGFGRQLRLRYIFREFHIPDLGKLLKGVKL